MEDARMMTDYRPACEAEALFAIKLGAKTQREYRQLLVNKESMKRIREWTAKPVPGNHVNVKYPYEESKELPSYRHAMKKSSKQNKKKTPP